MNLIYRFIFTASSLILLNQPIFAADLTAEKCITVDEKKLENFWNGPRVILKNTCSKPIEIAFCTTGESKENAGCGTGSKYYRHRETIKSGKEYNNPYILFIGKKIELASCFGEYGSIKKLYPDGTYTCSYDVKKNKVYQVSAAGKIELSKFLEKINDIKSSGKMASFISRYSGVLTAVLNHPADNILSLVLMDKNGIKVSYDIDKNISVIEKKRIKNECMKIFMRVNGNSGRGKKYTNSDRKFWDTTCRGV
jgi:hypothetical protein